MNARTAVFLACAGAACLAVLLLAGPRPQTAADADLGFTDTPMLPGQKWHVHDSRRPYPPVVAPGPQGEAAPPSDAIVLFNGKDLSQWGQKSPNGGALLPPKWKVENGYFEIVPRTGDLVTRRKFGDVQLHIEWSEPPDVTGRSQSRGNSGVQLMDRYEIQVLDPWNNPTYADGMAGAIYGAWPPLVNPGRKPGEWNAYDIVFKAPVFEGGRLKSPAFVTVFFNGALAHDHQQMPGTTVYRQVARYAPHGAEEPLSLQDHRSRVRFRNIWLRKLKGYS
ncbi:MAG TPA: DUF1080 domain-containing protein [Bryobacteraceae bacterium]|nr:DUF1080 domain-containing protein [Bryobacteraceae bacterium]